MDRQIDREKDRVKESGTKKRKYKGLNIVRQRQIDGQIVREKDRVKESGTKKRKYKRVKDSQIERWIDRQRERQNERE